MYVALVSAQEEVDEICDCKIVKVFSLYRIMVEEEEAGNEDFFPGLKVFEVQDGQKNVSLEGMMIKLLGPRRTWDWDYYHPIYL